MSTHARGSRYNIEAVTNAIRVIDLLTARGRISLAEVAVAAGVSKSTAFRIIATLEENGIAERNDDGGYRASTVLVRWAVQVKDGLDVRRLALPWLTALRDETQETVNLAIVRGAQILYTDVLESPSEFRVTDQPGGQVFAHATSLGKAICAHQPPPRLASLLGPPPFAAMTPHTITDRAALEAEFADIRSRGYSLDRQERSLGVSCVAAPLAIGGRVDSAISVSGPTVRMSEERLHQIGQQLASIARAVAEESSHPGVDGRIAAAGVAGRLLDRTASA